MLENHIHSESKELFEEQLNDGNVPKDAIAFIKDTKEIWNNGDYYGGSGTVDTELSDTSENAVQNKVVTAAINGIDTRVQEIEGFFDEGAKLNLTIKSNQGTDSTISAVKAIIEYDGQSVQAGSGVIGLPVFTDIKITFPDVEGYKTPAPLEFTTGALPVVYEVTYETELVNVTVTAWDGTSVVGQIITINGTQYTWNGTTIQHKVPFGTEYKVSGNSKDGYMEPEETFTASQAIRNITLTYTAIVGSWITLNQTITDPATMISGDVNGEHIQLIRNNSHRYLGKYTADGTMTVCQLDDTDSNLYSDGSAATLTGTEGDVFMKLPKFYYMAKEKQTDVWSIGFYYGESAPSSAWKEWEGNDLIGVYKATINGDKVYSVIGRRPNVGYSQTEWKEYVANRGNGFTMHKFRYNSMLAMLFYASYGNLNAQTVIGLGPSNTNDLTIGSTNDLGMEDTAAGINGDDTTNFWGLECLWSACGEYVCDLEQVYDTKVKLQLTIDGVPYIYDTKFNGYILKMAIGENLALIPTEIGGTATTGYCDYIDGPTTSSQVPSVGGPGSAKYGAASLDFENPNSYEITDATRLCFRGNVIINNDSTAFKALTAIG